MADDPVIPSPNDAPYVPTSEGMPSLPAAPGDFSEARDPRDPTNPWVPLTSARAATERQRLNFEESQRYTARGAARLVDLQRMATGEQRPPPTDFDPQYIPGSEGGASYEAPQLAEDQIQNNARRELEKIRADMIAYNAMPTFRNPVEFGMSATGQIAGALTSPENYMNLAIRPFTAAWRLAHPVAADVISYGLGQGAIQAAVDPAVQLAEKQAGLKKEYDPFQTAMAGGGGLLLGAGFGFAPHAAAWVKEFTGYPGAKALAEKVNPKVPPELMPAVEPKPQRNPGSMDFIEQYGPNYERLRAHLEEQSPAPGYIRIFKAEKPGEKVEGGRVEFTTNPAKAVVDAGPDGNVTYLDIRSSLAAASRKGDTVSVAESIAGRRQAVGEPPRGEAIPDPDAAVRGPEPVVEPVKRPAEAGAAPVEEPAPKPEKPPLSFTQFVRQQGGLKPDPELTAIYGRTNLNVIRKKGLTLDQMRERAVEAGYLPRAAEGMPEDPGAINRLLEMLSNEDKKIETHVPAGREAEVVRVDLKRQEAESDITASMQEMGLDPRARQNKELFERAVDEYYREGPDKIHPETAIENAGRYFDEIAAREEHYARPSEAEIPFDTGPARAARAGAEAGEPGRPWAGELSREVRGASAEEIAQRAIGVKTLGVEPGAAPPRPMPQGQQARLIQNLSDVMRSVTDKLEATVLKGEVQRGATGMYNVATHIARIRESTNNGFLTWIHEVLGHHVETTTGKPLQDYLNTPQNLQILRALAGPGAADIPPKQLMSEGFARFMEAYITNRAKIEEISPSFVRDFRNIMSKADPETLTALDEAHAGWQTYFNAPSVEVGISHIVSSWNIPTPQSADLLGRNAFGKAVDLTYQYLVNRQHPMTLLKRAIAEAHIAKHGTLIDIPTDRDFERFAQMFSNGTHGSAFSDLRDGFLNEKTMKREPSPWYSIRRRIGSDAVNGADGNEREIALRNQQFSAYAVATRQLTLRRLENEGKRQFEHGVITPYTDGQARQIVADTEAMYPNFKGLLDEVHAWNKQRIQKDYDHHIITKDEYDFYMHEDNHDYVPFNRDMRDIAAVLRKKGFGDEGIEELKRWSLGGSERNILDPLDEFERMVFQSHQQYAENRLYHSIRDAVRQVGGAEGAAIAEEVSAKKVIAKSLNIEKNIIATVLEHGLLMEDAKVLAREVLDQMGPKTRATLFSQEVKRGEMLVYGKVAGELQALRINDPDLAKGVVNVIDGMGPMGGKLYNEGLAFALNVLAKPAEILRLGVTTTGTYVVKNIVRDAVSHPSLTSESKIPFANALKSVRNWFNEKRTGELSDVSKNYTYFGGLRGGESFGRGQAGTVLEMGAKEKYGFAARVMQNTAAQLAEEAGIKGVPRGKNIVADSWSRALNWSEFSERGPRKGLFETVYNARIKQGWSEAQAAWDAGYKANDILAFNRYGAAMTEISRMIPFLRSSVSGIDKFRRMWLGGKNAPGVLSHYLGYGKALTVQQLAEIQAMKVNTIGVAMAAAALSYGLYLLNKDDPYIASLTEEQRANNWVTRLPGGKYLFIPKGFETGSIFNFAERTIELIATGDPKFAQKFLGSLGYSFNLPGVSQIPLFGPMLSLASNYDYYFDRPIVPSSKKGLAPHEQVNDYINPLSKYIADVLARNTDSTYWHKALKEMKLPLIGQGVGGILAAPFSPMESQFLMERVLGGWPRELGGPVGIATALYRGETPDYLGGTPGIRALVKDLNQAGEPSREIYDQIGQNEARLSIALRTYKYNIDNGQPEKAEAYFNSLDQVSREYVQLKVNPAGAVGLSLHPAERASVIARVINGMKAGIGSDAGIATVSDPSVRVKVEPIHRRELSNALTQLQGFEAQNGLIIQGASGWKNRPLIDTAPQLEIIERLSPEFYQEFTARMAQNRVLPVDAVAKAWPQVQQILRTNAGVDPAETAGEIKAVASDAYAGGTLGGGQRVGIRSYDVTGQRVKRGKKTYDIPQRVTP